MRAFTVKALNSKEPCRRLLDVFFNDTGKKTATFNNNSNNIYPGSPLVPNISRIKCAKVRNSEGGLCW